MDTASGQQYNNYQQPPVNPTPVVSQPPFPPPSSVKPKFSTLKILFLVLIVMIVGVLLGSYFNLGRVISSLIAPQPKACTMEVKLCPDGASVGRTGPNCEFAPCPTPQPTTGLVEGWKIYIDSKYGFSIKYPQSWEYKPCPDVLCGSFTDIVSNKKVVELEGISNSNHMNTYPSLINAEEIGMFSCMAGGPEGSISCNSPSNAKTITNPNGVIEFQFMLNELKNDIFSRTRGPYSFIYFTKPILSGGILYEHGVYFELLDKNMDSEFNQVLSTFKFIDETQETNICVLDKEYQNTAVDKVSCQCPTGYKFSVIATSWGPCPQEGMRDCPADTVKCVKE